MNSRMQDVIEVFRLTLIAPVLLFGCTGRLQNRAHVRHGRAGAFSLNNHAYIIQPQLDTDSRVSEIPDELGAVAANWQPSTGDESAKIGIERAAFVRTRPAREETNKSRKSNWLNQCNGRDLRTISFSMVIDSSSSEW